MVCRDTPPFDTPAFDPSPIRVVIHSNHSGLFSDEAIRLG